MQDAVRFFGLLTAACCGSAALAAGQVNSVSIEDAKTFLTQYAAQSALQSPQFLELYSDRAVVRARIEGQSAARAFEGRLYKRWVREALQAGKAALDASQFKDASVERRGARLVIRAKRYAANRCYWDLHYLVGIERDGARLVIVEERMTTQPQARCGEGKGAAPVAGVPAAVGYSASIEMGVVPAAPPGSAALGPNGAAVVIGSSTDLQASVVVGGPSDAQPPSMPPASMARPRGLPHWTQPVPMQPPPTMTAEQQAAEAIRLAQALAGGTAAAAPAGEGPGTARPARAMAPTGSAGTRAIAPAVVVSPSQDRLGAVVVTPSQ